MTAFATEEVLRPACFVGGREETGEGRFPVEYPYTGETVGEAPLLGRAVVRAALDLAASAQVRLDRHERATVLERVAARIAADAESLARLITRESGLCLDDTRHETGRAADVFRFAAHTRPSTTTARRSPAMSPRTAGRAARTRCESRCDSSPPSRPSTIR